MVRTAVAFSPGHISGYFKRVEGAGPGTGSVGAGWSSTRGLDGHPCRARAPGGLAGPSRRRVAAGCKRSTGWGYGRVTTECRLPIGAGFCLGGRGRLATLTAANLFDPLC